MNHEDKVKKVNEGRSAVLALQILEPLFKDMEKDLLASVKVLFRTGKYDEQVLACHVAQLVALEDIRGRLEGAQRTGESYFKQIEEGENKDG